MAADGTDSERVGVKTIAVGDGAVGKSCLLIGMATGAFPTEYVPTVADNFQTIYGTQQGHFVNLTLWDTLSREDYDRLRPLSYPQTDNVEAKWWPEVEHHSPSSIKFLVGTKSDLRADADTISKLKERNHPIITRKEAEEMAQKLRAAAYIETSALTGDNLAELKEMTATLGRQHSLENNGTGLD